MEKTIEDNYHHTIKIVLAKNQLLYSQPTYCQLICKDVIGCATIYPHLSQLDAIITTLQEVRKEMGG